MMPAAEYDKILGFEAQKRVCNALMHMLKNKNSNLTVSETNYIEDLNEKYDIRVQDEFGDVKFKYDVKNTSIDTGNISYTLVNCNGEKAVTSSKETNVDNIRLIFVFGDKHFDVMYVPDMNAWYEFVAKSEQRNGKTIVLEQYSDGKLEHAYGTRNGKSVDLYKYYHCEKVVRECAGDEVDIRIAHPYIYGKQIEVELSYDCKKRNWYFENGSKYILISKDQLKNLCMCGRGHIVPVKF